VPTAQDMKDPLKGVLGQYITCVGNAQGLSNKIPIMVSYLIGQDLNMCTDNIESTLLHTSVILNSIYTTKLYKINNKSTIININLNLQNGTPHPSQNQEPPGEQDGMYP